MPATSAARIAANRANSLKSKGPTTPEGKDASRGNALKHGLTAVKLLPEREAAEVERRSAAFIEELNPSGEVGVALARHAARMSVRMERCATHENAALTEHVRRALDEFVPPEGVTDEAEVARLRKEAERRAQFDASKEASLARKYEAAAERGFFRALKELRQLEKQSKADESAVEEEAYRRALGSFLPLEKGVVAAEPEPPAPAPMPAPRAVKQPRTILLEHIPGYSDVPFTIGRPWLRPVPEEIAPMNEAQARQARFNAESRDQWDGFAEHRRRVSDLLTARSVGGPGRLCVLGAGNGNDLDLAALLEAHREVHLVDLDPTALALGAGRQGVADHPSLRLHGNLDVTGMLDAIAGWSPLAPIAGADLEALVDWPPRRVGLALPGPFDVVASTCLLSQLVGNAFHSIGEAHPRFPEVVRGLRLGHLRLLAHLARPGGRVVLITDVVSSDRFPSLGDVPEPSLPALISRLARDRGLIHGVNPAELLSLFRRDPVLSARLGDVEVISPWRWRLHSRTYLVCAFDARVVAGPSS